MKKSVQSPTNIFHGWMGGRLHPFIDSQGSEDRQFLLFNQSRDPWLQFLNHYLNQILKIQQFHWRLKTPLSSLSLKKRQTTKNKTKVTDNTRSSNATLLVSYFCFTYRCLSQTVWLVFFEVWIIESTVFYESTLLSGMAFEDLRLSVFQKLSLTFKQPRTIIQEAIMHVE